VAEGFGLRAFRARSAGELGKALEDALAGEGPALISVATDPAPYGEMMRVLRG